MPLENLQQFLNEYNARSTEPGFDPDQFNQDFQRGLNSSGIKRTQPESAGGIKDKGFLRETAEAVAGGVSDAAEMWMRAIRTVDPEGGNDVIRDFATSGIDAIRNFVSRHPSLAPDANVEEGVKRWWIEGVRAFVPSLSAALPGIAVGTGIALVTGGVGAPVGAAIGSTFGGAIFGLAEFDRFKEEVEDFITDNELSEEDAAKLREQGASQAIYSAITEGGLEGAANALEILSLGLFRPVRRTLTGVVKRPIKELFKKSAGQIAKEAGRRLPRTAAIEVGTEVTQEALETKFRRDIGLTDLSSIDAAMSVIGPSLVTTLLFMGAAGGANSFQRYSIRKSLEEAKANPNKRKQAVREISDIVRATGQPDSEAIADQLLASGNRFVDEGISIDLNTQVGVQNALGEVIKGLRSGELDFKASQKYAQNLAEGLRSEELTGAERIKSTQLLQGITAINNTFEAQIPVKKPKVKKRKATASDKLRDLGDAATIKGKAPVVRETVEEPVEAPEALEELAEEVTEPVKEEIPVEEPEAEEIRVEREIEVEEKAPEEAEVVPIEERQAAVVEKLEEVAPKELTQEEKEAFAELEKEEKERAPVLPAQLKDIDIQAKPVNELDIPLQNVVKEEARLIEEEVKQGVQGERLKGPEGEFFGAPSAFPPYYGGLLKSGKKSGILRALRNIQKGERDKGVMSDKLKTIIQDRLQGKTPRFTPGTGQQAPERGNRFIEEAGALTEVQEELAEVKTEIDEEAQEAATSITNDIPQPSQEQIEAGNYKKGHVALQGLDISIENPKGSERSGFTEEGEPWTTIAVHHYGYIKGTVGRDKDHLDAYIGDNPESENVFVVNQVNPDTSKFDEHKVMIGFNTARQARRGYLANYQKGWQGLGSMVPLSMEEFKTWIKGDTTQELKPEAIVAPIKVPEKPVVKAKIDFSKVEDIDNTDLISALKKEGAEIDEDNIITVFHGTSQIESIKKGGVLRAGFNVTIHPDIALDFGKDVIEFKIPLNKLLPDDFPKGVTPTEFTINTNEQVPIKITEEVIEEDVAPEAKEEIEEVAVPEAVPVDVTKELKAVQLELDDATAIFVAAETKGKAKKEAKVKVEELQARRKQLRIVAGIELNPVDQAKKNITDKMGVISLGVDPTILKDMTVVGAHHFNSGLKTFVSWSKAMINDLGKAVKSFLRRVWRTVRKGGIQTDETTAFQKELNKAAEKEIPDKQRQAEQFEAVKETNAIIEKGETPSDIINQLNAFITNNEANVLNDKDAREALKKQFPDLKDEDINWRDRNTKLPHSKAKTIPEWKRKLGIQIKRLEEKNLFKNIWGGRKFNREDVKEGTKADKNEVFDLNDKEEQRVLALVTEGDARGVNGVEFTNEQLRAGVETTEMNKMTNKFKDMGKIVLTEKEITAYRAYQVTNKQIFGEITKAIEGLEYKPFQKEPWLEDLRKVVTKNAERVKPTQATFSFLEATDEQLTAPKLVATDIPKGLSDKQKEAFARAYDKLIKPQGRIQELRRQVGERKGYFPRIRNEGTIKVSFVGNDKRTFDSDIFRTNRQANKYITERRAFWKEKGTQGIEDKDFTVRKDTVTRTPESVFQDTSTVAIERFMNKTVERIKISREGGDPGKITGADLNTIKEAMSRELSNALKGRGFGASFIARSEGPNIAGYRIDSLKDILSGYISGAAGFITKMEAAYEDGQLMGEIDLSKKPKLYEDLSIYGRNMFRNLTRSDEISSKIRTFAFMWYLSGQLKSPAVNFTQNYILGIPELAKFTTGARRKYHRAMLDISTNNISELERGELLEALKRGITGDQLMQDIFGQVKLNTNKSLHTLIKILSFPFSQSEILNRKFAFLARFRAGIEQGETRQQAFDGARDFVENVHFLYGKLNQPIIASGGTPFSNVIRTSLTFRMYTLSYLNAMRNHIGDRNFALVGRSMAYMALLGGLSSLPFLEDFLDMWERFTGIPIRKKIQQELKGVGGDILAVVGTQGLPALIGVDLSGSLRIHLPDPFDPARMFEETVFGVYEGLAVKAKDSFQSILDGEPLRALEHAAPIFIEKPLKAFRVRRDGRVTTKTGKTIFTDTGRALKLSGLEAAVQSLGFRPAKLAFESGKFRQFTNIEANFRNRRTRLFRRLRFAKTREDRRKVLQSIREYNQSARKQRGAVPLITAESIRRAKKELPSKRFRAFSR